MLGLKAKLEHHWLCPGGFSKREVESRPRFDVPPATAVLLVVRSAGHPLLCNESALGLGIVSYLLLYFILGTFFHPDHIKLLLKLQTLVSAFFV